MKQKLLMMLAALMLMGTSAMAQSETLKGDVNGDGVVDVADINAVVNIMIEANDPGGVYYWYAGWTEPTEENIATIVNETYPKAKDATEMNPAGCSSTTKSGIEMNFTTNPVYDQEGRNNHPEGKKYHYVVVPNGYGIQSTTTGLFIHNSKATFEIVRKFNNHTVYKAIQAPTYIIQGIKLCEIK